MSLSGTNEPPPCGSPSSAGAGDIFATTHWTVVLAAKRKSDPQARAALEELCRTYWFPLYAFIRRRGRTKEDAEDLTQGFFETFLEKDFLARVDSERGRFRAYLLAALKHFLANEWDKARSQKRGGGVLHQPLDWTSADTQYRVAASNEMSPDRAFDREWATALLAKVLARLGAECATEGHGALFEALKPFLTAGNDHQPYAQVARALGMGEAAVRVAAHRLRKRYRALLRAEVANTLAEPASVDEELRALFSAFAANAG